MAGLEWVRQGIALFKKKPAEMFLFGNTYLFVLIAMALLPVLGPAMLTMITPTLGFGMMQAGKMAQAGEKVSPAVLFCGLSAQYAQHRKSLITLGIVYTLYFALIKLGLTLIVGPTPVVEISGTTPNAEQAAALSNYMLQYTLLASLFSLPVLLAFWFAPVLVVWHNMKPMHALFSSWVATWRNKLAFLVYGVSWVLLSTVCYIVFSLILAVLGLPKVFMGSFALMLGALGTAVFICTFYATYGVFTDHKPD